MEKLIFIALIIVIALIAIRIFTLPLKLLFKLILSTIIGFICLVLINLAGALIGLSIGINILNAVIIGVLGLPGLIFLLLLKWIFVL